MKKLYHYVICPYCIRTRMAFGFLGEKYESHVVAYDDEKTPKDLTGVKMLPIMQFEDGKAMNESLDIIKAIDTEKRIDFSLYEKNQAEIDAFLDEIAGPMYKLCMPYMIWSPEFDENSRKYFRDAKEKKRGPFSDLVKNKKEYLKQLAPALIKLRSNLHPYFLGDKFTVVDILVASHLWNLYLLPEFQFPPEVHMYLQKIKQLCQFDWHEDFWRD